MVAHHKPPTTRFLAAERDTLALGTALAPGLRAGMVIFLCGDLGAGKTTLARGVLQGLGVRDRVKSPTFTLVEPYALSSLYLYHFDFYRFEHPEEWLEAGLRDYFNAQAICLVEWPEKAGGQLPPPDLRIAMDIDGNGRRVTLNAYTQAGNHCLEQLT